MYFILLNMRNCNLHWFGEKMSDLLTPKKQTKNSHTHRKMMVITKVWSIPFRRREPSLFRGEQIQLQDVHFFECDLMISDLFFCVWSGPFNLNKKLWTMNCLCFFLNKFDSFYQGIHQCFGRTCIESRLWWSFEATCWSRLPSSTHLLISKAQKPVK